MGQTLGSTRVSHFHKNAMMFIPYTLTCGGGKQSA